MEVFAADINENLLVFVKDRLNEEQLRVFADNFLVTLIDTCEQFPISGELAMLWLGYTRKDVLKNSIIKHLVRGQDFIEVFHAQVENPLGGRPSEMFKLTVDAFKILGMKADTVKGSLIRSYYLELEKLVFEFGVQQHKKLIVEMQTEKQKLLEDVQALQAQVAKKQKKNYEYGETVYIARGRYKNLVYHKVGSSNNMNARNTSYGSHTLDVEIIYTLRCHKRKVLEDLIHEVLRMHSVGNKPDCFNLPFDVVKEVMDACHVFIEGTSMVCEDVCDMKLTDRLGDILCFDKETSSGDPSDVDTEQLELVVAPPENGGDEQNDDASDEEYNDAGDDSDDTAEAEAVQAGDVIDLPTLNDCSNYDKFIDDCFITGTGASTIMNIQARYRLWARSTSVRCSKLAQYLKLKGFKTVKVYDEVELTANLACAGLVMKPLPPLEMPTEPNDYYNFITECCTIIVSGRVGSVDIKNAFQAWKRMGDPTYKVTSQDYTQMNAILNKEFVRAVVTTKDRQRGGWWGVCLKGDEKIGTRKNLGNRKKIAVVDAETGRVKKIYESAQHASHELNISEATISKHRDNTIYKGMRFATVS